MDNKTLKIVLGIVLVVIIYLVFFEKKETGNNAKNNNTGFGLQTIGTVEPVIPVIQTSYTQSLVPTVTNQIITVEGRDYSYNAVTEELIPIKIGR